MEIVGHSVIEMTMNVYGQVNLDVQRAALDALDDLERWAAKPGAAAPSRTDEEHAAEATGS